MKSDATLWRAVIVLSVAVVGGCGTPGEIPAGNWAGEGTYVDYEGVFTGEKPMPEERSASRTYETTLEITRTRMFDREALLIDIHSKRGKLFNVPGEETRLSGVLVLLRTLENGSALYAVYDARSVTTTGSARGLPPETAARATSVRTLRGLVLQMHYNRPGQDDGVFTDTFHFLPGRIIKTGSYAVRSGSGDSTKLARVWWVEELSPTR